MKRFLATICLFWAMQAGASAQANDVFIPIAKYMATGDAESLSAWFAPSLEISLINTPPAYCSKAQATQIMKAFFKTYSPTDFMVSQQANKGRLKYALAQMKTSEEVFNVIIYVSLTPDRGYLIQQLQIETDE